MSRFTSPEQFLVANPDLVFDARDLTYADKTDFNSGSLFSLLSIESV